MSPAPFTGKSNWTWADTDVWSAPTPHGQNPFRMAYFRRSFTAPANARLTAHVSADSRYVLYCNGHRVGRGPAKGDVRHHFYETYELDPYLRIGENVIAAVVLSYSSAVCFPPESSSPTSVMFAGHMFVFEGELRDSAGELLEPLHTAAGWKARLDDAYVYARREGWDTFTGMLEDVYGERYPWEWQDVDHDDSGWSPAMDITSSAPRSVWHWSEVPHMLTPRTIPVLEEIPQRFSGAGRAEGGSVQEWEALIREDAPVTFPANTRVGVTVFSDTLTTAFPELATEGGAGGCVRLTYSEGLFFDGRKQPRHEPDLGEVRGYYDRFFPGGGSERYEPLHWRTFRYVRVDIETGDEPLTITRLTHRFTAYPFEENASFSSSDPRHAKMWEMSWRTARLCAHETYEDCPYFEQLQYGGDTQVQALLSYYVSGDARLARQAIRHFDWSRDSDGLVRSRYPSQCPQDIPTYAFLWMIMVRDYWWHTGDAAEVAALLPGIETTLRWFERHENSDGVLDSLPFWNFVDWVAEWTRGMPPNANEGVSAVINFEYAAAMHAVAEVAGDAALAAKLRAKAAQTCEAINETCWWPERGLYRDRPGGEELSEATNAWAILASATDAGRNRLIAERLGRDDALAKATLYGRFYVFRAMDRSGAYERADELLDHWYAAMKTDLTTFPENPRHKRSYCHGWSAAPLYEFLAQILGVKPAEAGYAKVRVRPHLWSLKHAEGSVPTPHGSVSVRWRIDGGRFSISVDAPRGVPVELILPDGTERTGNGSIEAACRAPGASSATHAP